MRQGAGKKQACTLSPFSTKEPIVKNFICFILIAMAACTARSQSTYTDRLKKQANGEGKVIIVQDPEIDDIVNNVRPNKSGTPAEKKETGGKSDAHKQENTGKGKESATQERPASAHIAGTRHRVKAVGYRIQIFTGGNSHHDKAKAFELAENCRKFFPELSVYPRFTSPRWICRVGDFRTREDALKYASKIRAKRISTEVHIVKCEVLLAR